MENELDDGSRGYLNDRVECCEDVVESELAADSRVDEIPGSGCFDGDSRADHIGVVQLD